MVDRVRALSHEREDALVARFNGVVIHTKSQIINNMRLRSSVVEQTLEVASETRRHSFSRLMAGTNG